MAPMVSIIIPVFNSENTIEISIKSILNQTYSNFEIIIVNDGSTDSTNTILEKFSKVSNIKSIYQENSGVSVARNTGVNNSNGAYICFLDSDDYLDRTFLEKMVKRITETNADYCYCGYRKFNEKESKKIPTKFSNKDVLLKYIKGIIRVSTGGWIINKKYIRKNNIEFSEGVSWGEDVEYYYKVLSYSSNGTYVSEYLTNIRNMATTNRLSNFTIKLIDEDYNFVMRVINNDDINLNSEIEKALIEDRLSPLITYKLWRAYRLGYDLDCIRKYYKKYRRYIDIYTWNRGFDSLRLNIVKYLLNTKLKE